jgi:hypothetical protein
MTMKKKVLTSLVIVSVSMPLLAMAADLTIINNTNQDSTSIINGGPCSNILGASGVTRAHTTTVVPEYVIKRACIFNKSNCQADVHMTDNCSGPTIAKVVFDVNSGIKSVTPVNTSLGYSVSGNSYAASINGGPTSKNWLQKFLGL